MASSVNLLPRLFKLVVKFKPIATLLNRFKLEFAKEYTTERVVEYPWIFINLRLEAGKVLDVGCCKSKLSIQLASLGYEVFGIDIMDYNYTHPAFKFSRQDITKMTYDSGFFDRIIAVSVIEHVGIADGSMDTERDKAAVKEMARVLKPEGIMLITVPFGRNCVTPNERIYSTETLNELFGSLNTEIAVDYFVFRDGKWVPSSENEAAEKDSSNGAKAVACVKISPKGKHD
jgi:SAM-dependent methyltransferase